MSLPEIPILHLVTVVWGEDYTDIFCRITLRSLLAPGNLPALADNVDLHYFVHITAEDGLKIQQDPAWSALQRLAKVQLVTLPLMHGAENFNRVSPLHIKASNEAARRGAYIGFIIPGCLYSDGSIGGLWSHIKGGKTQAVMTLGMRVKRESILPILTENFSDDAVLQISSRDCVALAFDHLHQFDHGMFWGVNDHVSHLSHIYFQLEEKSLLAFCWHLHPILVKPNRADLLPSIGTIDGGKYLNVIIESWEDVVVITDSDQFFSFKVLASSHSVDKRSTGPITVSELAKWVRYNGNGIYRKLFQTPIWIHAQEPTAIEVQRRDRTEYLIKTTVVAPVLELNKISFFLSRLVLGVTWLRKRYLFKAYHWIKRKRMGLRRRGRRAVQLAVISIFRRSPVVRNLGLKAGSLALALGPKDIEARSLLQRQQDLAIDLIRYGASVEAEALIRPLLSNPQLDVARLSRDLFDAAMKSLNVGDLDGACRFFRLSAETSPTPDNRFYFDLVATLIELKKDAEERAATYLAEQGVCERFVFSAVVWGNEYIDNFMRYTVRTLLAPGNLPILADAKAYFSIVTTPSGVERIRESLSFSLLERHIEVIFFTFPEELTQSFHYSKPNVDFYRLYGALDHTSIHFARALKAHIFFIVVDGLLSNNTISNLRKYLSEGYDICANASIVSDRETLLPAIDRQYEETDAIDIAAYDLANIGFAHRHHYISQRLVMAENRDFDKYPRELYFPTEEGLVVHALYQHPLVISARAICGDIDFDYYVVDANLMGRILDRREKFSRLKVVTDSNDVYVANYAPAGRKFESTSRALNVDDFVAVHHYSLPIHHYIWEHRQLIRCDTILRTNVDPHQIADSFLSSLKKKLHQLGKL